jgi:DNA-binding CsgD family transcriptional regulator
MRATHKDPSIYLIALFLILSVADIAREYHSGESADHLVFEFFICISAFLWSLFLWYKWLTTRENLNSEINRQRKVVHDFHDIIIKQFGTWALTPTESDVAMLLLKGLPFKEIAVIRQGSEKTIRNHALKIYQKSGLPGRTELFAYFFEDLLNQ